MYMEDQALFAYGAIECDPATAVPDAPSTANPQFQNLQWLDYLPPLGDRVCVWLWLDYCVTSY